MVKIMTASISQQQAGLRCLYDESDELIVYGGSWLPTDPSTCIFWSAVGLGALLQGRPFETVSRAGRVRHIILYFPLTCNKRYPVCTHFTIGLVE